MSEINGLDNEYEFVKYLNKKKISELNPMFYDLIKSLFPEENESSTISCWRNHYKQKSDIFVKINNTMRGISIKKGMKNSFHVERISDFINFLIFFFPFQLLLMNILFSTHPNCQIRCQNYFHKNSNHCSNNNHQNNRLPNDFSSFLWDYEKTIAFYFTMC